MVRESKVTICQGMHSNLGDLPSILFFYVFPVRTNIIVKYITKYIKPEERKIKNLYVSLFR